ncbi:hypothetical protein U9382_24470, partial [Escherichia coli]
QPVSGGPNDTSVGEISVKTGNNARNGGKNSLNRLIRCVCGKKIGPDPRNFNQRVSLGRNDLLIRTFHNIPADWAVEMTCKLGRDGATPHPRITHFDDKVMGLIHTIKGFEIAASNAALSGEFNDVLLALNLSPLVHSDRDAELLAREMILAHEKWLPNFADCIAELKKAH